MKLLTRLALLLASLAVLFGVAGVLLRVAQDREAAEIRTSIRAERDDLLGRLIDLRGRPLEEFARDYGLWDEMVRFLQTGDATWAAVNVEASLANFDAQAAWVLRADGSRHYAVAAAGRAELLDTLPADAAFVASLRAAPDQHFFVRSAAGVLEIRTAPILPSDDIHRTQAPRGWFVTARLWNDEQLRSLGESLQSRVTFAPDGPPASPETIRLERTLRDWRGAPLAVLHVDYDSQTLAALVEGSRADAWLLYGFGALVLGVVGVAIWIWLVRPLRAFGRSLGDGRHDSLAPLLERRDEFGHLSRQLAHSFIQRDALRESEARLLQSIDLRARLARDLHDGIIQSIYAAGLGLESARTLRATNPAAAEQRLATSQQMLNETLWQVRNFIGALEPESDGHQSTSQSIAALVTSMQAVQSLPIAVDLDQEIAARIGPGQQLQVLQLLRELLSNALRHSAATQIRVVLRSEAGGGVRLEVADDGIGFDAANPASGGHGLRNLSSRVKELRGEIEVDTAPGKGTRIAVRFHPDQAAR